MHMLFHNGETISGYLLVGMKSLCQASGRTLCAVYRRTAGFSVLIPGKFFPTAETFCSLKSLGSHDRHVQNIGSPARGLESHPPCCVPAFQDPYSLVLVPHLKILRCIYHVLLEHYRYGVGGLLPSGSSLVCLGSLLVSFLHEARRRSTGVEVPGGLRARQCWGLLRL